jgi:hypothetical protein
MALFQSEVAKRRETPPTGYVAGTRMTAIFTYTFSASFTAASDKLEIGLLPADTQIVNVKMIPEGLTASNTVDVGFMSGTPGDPDDARTVGDEIFDGAAAVNTDIDAPPRDLLAIARSTSHRAIGVTCTENITGGAAKKLTLIVDYVH